MGIVMRGNVYLEKGVNCYEKISRLEKEPFWGLSLSILEKLKSDDKPFVVKLIWDGKGGIIIDEADLDYILKGKRVAKDKNYKIKLYDFDNHIKEKWNNSLSAKIK